MSVILFVCPLKEFLLQQGGQSQPSSVLREQEVGFILTCVSVETPDISDGRSYGWPGNKTSLGNQVQGKAPKCLQLV